LAGRLRLGRRSGRPRRGQRPLRGRDGASTASSCATAAPLSRPARGRASLRRVGRHHHRGD